MKVRVDVQQATSRLASHLPVFGTVGLTVLLIAAALVGASPAAVTPASALGPPPDMPSAMPLRPYRIQLAGGNALVLADAPIAQLTTRAQQNQGDWLALALA